MTKPIKPSEIHLYKKGVIPEFVFEAFNQCIAAKYSNGRATVKQDDVIAKIQTMDPVSRQEIFDKGWLNVEEVYEAEGWKVEYDKPGYNESYGAFFVFKG